MILGCHCGFRILLYHAVGTRLKHDSYGISIDPLLFERHMQILAQLEDAEVVGLRRPEPGSAPLRVAITLDDGYKDNLHVATPILLKYGMPFTVFATVSYVRSRAPEYLTPEELRELAGFPGATIGSHGVSHLPLADCDEVTVWHELEESRRFLEEAIGLCRLLPILMARRTGGWRTWQDGQAISSASVAGLTSIMTGATRFSCAGQRWLHRIPNESSGRSSVGHGIGAAGARRIPRRRRGNRREHFLPT